MENEQIKKWVYRLFYIARDDYGSTGKHYDDAVEVINQIRQDTLRQVLPEKQDICWSELNDKEIIARECEKYGGNEMIDKIQNKAKELWGIELNNN